MYLCKQLCFTIRHHITFSLLHHTLLNALILHILLQAPQLPEDVQANRQGESQSTCMSVCSTAVKRSPAIPFSSSGENLHHNVLARNKHTTVVLHAGHHGSA